MKRSIIFSLFAMIIFVTMSSCNQSRLKELVESVNNECPILLMGDKFDDIGHYSLWELSSLELVGNNLIMNNIVHDNSIENYKIGKSDLMKKNFLLSYLCLGDENVKKLLFALDKKKVGLTLKFKGYVEEKMFTLSLTPIEIAKVMNSSEAKDPMNALLEMMVEQFNASLLLDDDDDDDLTKITLEDKYIVLNYSVDEDDFYQLNEKELKKDMVPYVSLVITKSLGSSNLDLSGMVLRFREKVTGIERVFKYSAAEMRAMANTVNMEDFWDDD